MSPEPSSLAPLPPLRDAELEWLLCLTAAFRSCEHQTANLADEGRLPSRLTSLAGLRALLKGLWRAERKRAA